jgi:hypothetical protein
MASFQVWSYISTSERESTPSERESNPSERESTPSERESTPSGHLLYDVYPSIDRGTKLIRVIVIKLIRVIVINTSERESTPSEREFTPSGCESTPSENVYTPSERESTPSGHFLYDVYPSIDRGTKLIRVIVINLIRVYRN